MEYVWNMREKSWKVEPSSPTTSGPEWAQALRWRLQDQGTIRELYAKATSGTQLKPQQKAPGCGALTKRDRAMIELIKNSYAQNLYVSCLSTPLAQNLNFFISFSLKKTSTFSYPSHSKPLLFHTTLAQNYYFFKPISVKISTFSYPSHSKPLLFHTPLAHNLYFFTPHVAHNLYFFIPL